MKKVVVLSDNHGFDDILDEIKILEPDADYFIHCGDSEARRRQLLDGMICVAGNNDWGIDLPRYAKIQIEDLKILITHGQYYGYFSRQQLMEVDLKKHGCQALFSGHTHIPDFSEKDGFYFLNPGSTTLPRGGSPRSYAVAMIDGSHMDVEFKEL